MSNVPLASGLAAGHGTPNMALPLGLTATLDVDAGTLVYDEQLAEVP